MRILILALSGIGDALMFTPSISMLRQYYPDAEIEALVMFKGVKDIYERDNNLNKIIYFDFMKEGALKSLKFLHNLRGRYDISFNVYPANRSEYNIIQFIIGAAKRGGVKYLRKDFRNFGFLNNYRITEDDKVHNVNTNLKLVSKILPDIKLEELPLKFVLKPEDIRYAQEFCSNSKLESKNLVVGFHPGSAVLKNHVHRRWEPQKFAELGRILIKEYNAKVLIFGGPEEDELKDIIKTMISSPEAISVKTENLAQSAAIMKNCSLFISNDSSLMHVASAMQLKVIAILGPTNPYYIHPWKTPYKIVRIDLSCSPCFIYSPRPLICFRDDVKYKCIKELDVDFVLNAVKEMIK